MSEESNSQHVTNHEKMKEKFQSEEKVEDSQNIEVDELELKTIEIRLTSIKDATQRSRFVFIIMTIISSAILIVLWNATFSWDSGLAGLSRDIFSTDASVQRTIFNRDQIIGEWIKNQVVSIGLLGIRISVVDLAVIGSLSLIVTMVWFFFSQRRENRAIVTLLRDVYEACEKKRVSKEVCQLVYHGIVQSVVFIDMGGGDNPISGIKRDGSPPSETKKSFHSYLLSKIPLRTVLSYLVYLPPFTILMIFIADILSLCFPSSIRDCKNALIWCLFSEGEGFSILKIIMFEITALWAIYYTWGICDACKEFSKSTADTIKEFRKELNIQ